jgi:hypothetical protein
MVTVRGDGSDECIGCWDEICTGSCQLRWKVTMVLILHAKVRLLREASGYWIMKLVLHPCPFRRI